MIMPFTIYFPTTMKPQTLKDEDRYKLALRCWFS